MKTYSNPVYAYERSPDQDSPLQRHPVIVVGAGPVGLAAAIDLALHDVPVVVLDDDDTVSVGSRAICYAKRALEILDRLGCGERIVEKGVEWKVGARSFATSSSMRSTCCPRAAIIAPRSSICSNTISRNAWSTALAELPAAEISLAEQGRRGDAARERSAAARRHAGRRLRARLRVADRLRRLAQPGPHDARSRSRRAGVSRPLPDRRRPHEVEFPAERWFWFDPPFHPGPVGAPAPAG